MTVTRLTPDLAPADLTAWQLVLKVSPEAFSALILGPQGPERAVIAHSEPLPDSSLEALENAIYDNPLILSDFGRVDILVASSQRVMIPASVSEEMDEEIVEAMLPDSDGSRRLISAPVAGDLRLVAALDTEKLSFISRTFPDGRISMSMAMLVDAVGNMRSESDAVNVAFIEPGELTLISFNSEGRLAFANRFGIDGAPDCAYFILAALGPEVRDLSIGGDADLRNETIEQLRLAVPDFEPMPLFLTPQIADLRCRADYIPLDLFYAAVR